MELRPNDERQMDALIYSEGPLWSSTGVAHTHSQSHADVCVLCGLEMGTCYCWLRRCRVKLLISQLLSLSLFRSLSLSRSWCPQRLQRSACWEATSSQSSVWSSPPMTSRSSLQQKTVPSSNVSWIVVSCLLVEDKQPLFGLCCFVMLFCVKCLFMHTSYIWFRTDLIQVICILYFTSRGCGEWEETSQNCRRQKGNWGQACRTHSPCSVHGHLVRWQIPGENTFLYLVQDYWLSWQYDPKLQWVDIRYGSDMVFMKWLSIWSNFSFIEIMGVIRILQSVFQWTGNVLI